eukprot:CAMPEP_0119529548 /NCGR_PEP_ID=MMETSP1344-20130328/43546_1 /TAXON_ID=236787 /ORGANISM="Florenciella parvula, Strain CCMP2471" /LENGTH=157 /DNA_ID=CAMNT_0007569211 /DNA_START=70 /DNA_END=543 /DNA_ORIENTATION=-
MKFQILALVLAFTGAAAFTRGTPMRMSANPQQTSGEVAKYEGPPVNGARAEFCYGRQSSIAPPQPLGGTGRGYEADMRGTSSDPAVTDDSSATQWGFRYGRGSPAPKPLGGTGNGYEYDQARGKARQQMEEKTRESFKYGSGNDWRTPKPMGGINPF